MSNLHTSIEVLDDHLVRALKPAAIAGGYYNEVLTALDEVYFRARQVSALVLMLRNEHSEKHPPGPMSLCESICRMVDQL